MFGLIVDYIFCPQGLNALFALLCVAGACGLNGRVVLVASAMLYAAFAVLG